MRKITPWASGIPAGVPRITTAESKAETIPAELYGGKVGIKQNTRDNVFAITGLAMG